MNKWAAIVLILFFVTLISSDWAKAWENVQIAKLGCVKAEKKAPV